MDEEANRSKIINKLTLIVSGFILWIILQFAIAVWKELKNMLLQHVFF